MKSCVNLQLPDQRGFAYLRLRVLDGNGEDCNRWVG